MIELKIDELTRRYGNHTVVDRYSLVTTQSPLGIAGANGSGKSTLLKCLSGLLKPSSGTITWTQHSDAQTRSGSPAELNHLIGFAAPYVELYETLSVRENLTFLSRLHTASDKASAAVSLDTHLEFYQAERFSDHPYGDLSTGQRQRVKLAAATLHNPKILCLDEPGANLDEDGRELVTKTIQRFREEGCMVVIASNQPSELDICRQVLKMELNPKLV
jgi:ABC-type multidrug transport system ATPase subunit